MRAYESFNRSGFSRFINSHTGQVFRLVAGALFLIGGFLYRHHPLGIASMVWSVFPLSAGGFDWCYFSAALGGPFRGSTIRAQQDAK